MKATSLFATDFDGTLLRNDRSFSSEDLLSLQKLREAGCVVVLASGRSPFSLERSLKGRKLPVDWYVLSSGAGVLNEKGTVRLSHTFSPEETLEVHSAFVSLGLDDVSIQGPFPEAHKLHWIPGSHGDDFLNRLELYRGYSDKVDSAAISASEVIGFINPRDASGIIDKLSILLGDRYSVIRATSPIDLNTVWIEVFPAGVSKASACEFIRRELEIDIARTAAVGNDWNDVHMLEWAQLSFVVGNSPRGLTAKYNEVPSNDAGGVAAAAKAWLEILQ